MKLHTRILGGILLAAILTSTTLRAEDKASVPPKAESALDKLFPDEDVAKGKGVIVKRSRLDDAISALRGFYSSRGTELTPRDLPLVEKEAFDHLVNAQLIGALATEAEKTKAGKEVDKQIEALKKKVPNQDELERLLKSRYGSIEKFRANALEDATMAEVLRSKVTLTDEDVAKYYTDNPTRFQEPELVKIKHILFLALDKTGVPISADDKKVKLRKAEDVVKRAKAGEDFAKLADEFSEDPTVKDNHGDLTIPKDSSGVPKEFEGAAFSLTAGQVSDLVVSQLGYHIIKSIEKVPAKKIELEKIKADLRAYLESVEINKILPTFVEKLKKDADIQIVDDQLKNALKIAEDTAKAIEAMNASTNHAPMKAAPDKEKEAAK